jgi:hypothetical protein
VPWRDAGGCEEGGEGTEGEGLYLDALKEHLRHAGAFHVNQVGLEEGLWSPKAFPAHLTNADEDPLLRHPCLSQFHPRPGVAPAKMVPVSRASLP